MIKVEQKKRNPRIGVQISDKDKNIIGLYQTKTLDIGSEWTDPIIDGEGRVLQEVDYSFSECEDLMNHSKKEKDAQAEQSRKSNMEYLGLTEFEILLHETIMEIIINKYPKSLTDKIKRMSEQYGYCGELHISAVSEWIKDRLRAGVIPTNVITQIILNEQLYTEIRDRIIKRIEAYDPEEKPKVNKRCGTCENFCDNCKRGWSWFFPNRHYVKDEDNHPICETDGANCPDWKPKEPERPKEKMRVWTCVNCGRDIMKIDTYSTFAYTHTDYYHCCDHGDGNPVDERYGNLAIPKPGSERWVRNDN